MNKWITKALEATTWDEFFDVLKDQDFEEPHDFYKRLMNSGFNLKKLDFNTLVDSITRKHTSAQD